MPTVPYATLTISVSAGAPQTGGITAVAGDTLRVRAESTAGWETQRFEIYSYPDGFATPAGWTLDAASGAIYYETNATPPDITVPALWGKWAFRLIVNGAIPVTNTLLTDEATSVMVLSETSLRGLHYLEGGQFGDFRQWVGELMQDLTRVDTLIRPMLLLSASGSDLTSVAATETWGPSGARVVSKKDTAATADATPTAAVTTACLDNTVTAVDAVVVAVQQGTTNFAKWKVSNCFARTGAGAAVNAVAAAASKVETIGSNAGAPPVGWDAVLDLTGNSWRVLVTGAAATNINWFVVHQRIERAS